MIIPKVENEKCPGIAQMTELFHDQLDDRSTYLIPHFFSSIHAALKGQQAARVILKYHRRIAGRKAMVYLVD